MTTPVLTFFNNKGGVGKTSLIYHLAWMFASRRKRVVIVDLDPQANLTAAFLDEDRIENIWNGNTPGSTIFQCVKPLTGVGDIVDPVLQNIASDLYLLPGDVNLSGYEETLFSEWTNSMGSNNLYRPMRILSSFWQVMQNAAAKVQADIILVDSGPNLGAINRSVLIATNYVVTPLSADLFSVHGLKNLGATLNNWAHQWKKRLENWSHAAERKGYPDFSLPQGQMQPIGYICRQQSVYQGRPAKAYDEWGKHISGVYREAVLAQPADNAINPNSDPYCLATIKHYRSLIPMAQEHRKPIFNLTSADGAIGSHAGAVQDAKADFNLLAEKIAGRIGIDIR